MSLLIIARWHCWYERLLREELPIRILGLSVAVVARHTRATDFLSPYKHYPQLVHEKVIEQVTQDGVGYGARRDTGTKEARSTPMIRGFSLLCKINFRHYSTLDLFYCCMSMIKIHECPCPVCGTRHPCWTEHAMYPRFLIGFDSGIVCCHSIMVTRFICQSCRSTHALLPEFVIPFKSHSLFFVLAVLKDYFLSSLTVSQLCAKYEIPPATLYS